MMNAPLPPTHPIETVDSLAHPLARWLRQLLDGKEEQPTRHVIIDDQETILQALHAGVRVEHLFYTADQPLDGPLRQALPDGALVHEIAKRTAKKLFATSKWSRTFAVARAPKAATLSELATRSGDIVVLDRPAIAGNVGAIIRTAVALGAGGIVLLDAAIDSYDRRLIRASRGYAFALPVVTTTTEAWLAFCRRQGVSMAVASPHAATSIQEIAKLSERLALVFGSEKEGCSRALKDAADLQVTIPTAPQVESLNVSAAAAIVLFQRTLARDLLPLSRHEEPGGGEPPWVRPRSPTTTEGAAGAGTAGGWGSTSRPCRRTARGRMS